MIEKMNTALKEGKILEAIKELETVEDIDFANWVLGIQLSKTPEAAQALYDKKKELTLEKF